MDEAVEDGVGHGAVVSFVTGKLDSNAAAFPHGIAAQIERPYRGVYLLATLQRDEVIHDRRQKELEKITNLANEARTPMRSELDKRLKPRS